MSPTRRQRRLVLVCAVIALPACVSVLRLPPVHPETPYVFLEQHRSICNVIRVGFVLAGHEGEFDLHIFVAEFNRIVGPEVATITIEPMDVPYRMAKTADNKRNRRADDPR
jgi:hypothetical protein